MKFSESVVADLKFNQILVECSKFSHSTKTKEKVLGLSVISNKSDILVRQKKVDCLLSSLQRGESIPIEIFPEINEIFLTLQIENNPLNELMFRDLFMLLDISQNLQFYLKKEQFIALQTESSSLYLNSDGQKRIKKIFDETWQVSPNASPQLYKIYNAIRQTESSIDKKMNSLFIKAKKNDWLHGENIQLLDERKVLPIKVSYKRKIAGITFGQSSTGQVAYIEPIEVVELRNDLIGLESSKKAEIFRILLTITDTFRSDLDYILKGYEALVNIDMYCCIAQLGNKLNCNFPTFCEKNDDLIIRNGLNPSLLIQQKEIIPLNIVINPINRLVLITGPNAGGKTVVLKTFGLFVLMAQSGFPLPAKEVVLPLFSKIFTDIGDRQSIENDLSTYSAHLNEISHIIENCDSNSLILMDELGTGTDPDAGASLAQSAMEHILKQNSWLMATTHLGRLKLWAQETKGILNSRMVFDQEKLMPTYEIKIGKPGSSFALEIAKRMKVNQKIIDRAKELLGDKSLRVEFLLTELERERREVDKIKSRMNFQRKYIQEAEERIQKLEESAEQQYKTAEQDALDDVHQLILETRKDTEKLIHQIKSQQADEQTVKKARQKLDENLRVVSKRRNESKKKKIEPQSQFQQRKKKKNSSTSTIKLVEGLKIEIPLFDAEGVVIQKPNSNGQITVEFNGKRLRINQDQVIPLLNDEKEVESDKIATIEYSKPVSMQLDLRGKRVDDGIERLTQFLDGALVSGLQSVNILHGKGTGAMQTAVQEYLKTQSFVIDFQFAPPDSGGAGITVVDLK
jgi:DNA mismatch repair protein MutS2